MSRIFGRMFQQKRLEKGWTLPDLARRMPQWNQNKACTRIIAFERGERDLDSADLDCLAAALEVGAEEMARIRHEEKEALKKAFAAWQARPGTNQLYYRAMPCVFARRAIPDKLNTDDEVIEYAQSFSRDRGVIAWLYLGRRERLALRDGKITRRRPFTPQNFQEPDFGVSLGTPIRR